MYGHFKLKGVKSKAVTQLGLRGKWGSWDALLLCYLEDRSGAFFLNNLEIHKNPHLKWLLCLYVKCMNLPCLT